MITTGNEVQNVDLSGGTKGALWTTAGALIANVLQKGGGGGLLNGIVGGAPAPTVDPQVSALQAEIAKLQAEKYSDNAAKEESNRLLVNYLKPYGNEIADARVREATLTARVDCIEKTQALQAEITKKEIQLAKQEAACCCQQNANAIATVAETVNQIIKVGVPSAVVINPTTTTGTGA